MNRPDLCLEFANTRYWRGQDAPTETLNAPEDLAAWTTANEGLKLTKPPARREFERALELRELVYRLFDAHAQAKAPAARDLETLNEALSEAPTRTTLKRERGSYAWDVDMRSGTALALLAPVLWTAGDLLAGPRLDRVRRCANPECGWLFLDDSRAGKRRWCSMQSCGNRAKARRHYHKSREA
ncbi:ABATE domain-containing protein [Reyranella sp.]|uniref:CGNR zinc finger domain-containing protein n=1 Tax=Reyranella sp. TaxID=1929291 RepID=UPI002730E798|nr:ABATE domain-containing protein [Reyranella sp.]MDP2377747.1 CGNR zinc finger domain-containing protein [Reyranella sp.]